MKRFKLTVILIAANTDFDDLIEFGDVPVGSVICTREEAAVDEEEARDQLALSLPLSLPENFQIEVEEIIVKNVYCPSCGHYHRATAIRGDDDNIKEYEAGPYNGDSYLYERDTNFCKCPECGNVFTSDRHAAHHQFTVISINNETGKTLSDHVDARDAYQAMYKVADVRREQDVSLVAAIHGHLKDLNNISYAGTTVVDVGTVLDDKGVFDADTTDKSTGED